MKPIYELGEHEPGKWWCRDATRPGLIVADDGMGNEFDCPEDALLECRAAGIEYDALKRANT